MRIGLDGVEAEVIFRHYSEEMGPYKAGTMATVGFFLPGSSICIRLLAGASRLHPHDIYCRRTGRRVSLTKAIASLDRETRRNIWEGLKQKGVKFF
jgi:hypothetical protein